MMRAMFIYLCLEKKCARRGAADHLGKDALHHTALKSYTSANLV